MIVFYYSIKDKVEKIWTPQFHCVDISFPSRRVFKKKLNIRKFLINGVLTKFFSPFPLPFPITISHKFDINFLMF